MNMEMMPLIRGLCGGGPETGNYSLPLSSMANVGSFPLKQNTNASNFSYREEK